MDQLNLFLGFESPNDFCINGGIALTRCLFCIWRSFDVINLDREQLIPFSKAAREVVPGGPVHSSTIWRWSLRGVKGVKLEFIMRGGLRFTSREAIARFLTATTAAARNQPAETSLTDERRRAIAEAERELAENGF